MLTRHQVTSGKVFRDHKCSYLDVIEDDGITHLIVPHRWERVLHLQFQESELSKSSISVEHKGVHQ